MEAFSHVVESHFEGIILFVLTLNLLGLIPADIRDHEGTSSRRAVNTGCHHGKATRVIEATILAHASANLVDCRKGRQ